MQIARCYITSVDRKMYRCFETPTMKKVKFVRYALCHPEREHEAFGLCALCYLKQYFKKHPEKLRKAVRNEAHKLKVQVLSHYGPQRKLGCCWANCEVVDVDMLSLDHIHNDGAEHRRKSPGLTGLKIYRQLRKNDFPEGFQTLCFNHQWKKNIVNLRLTRRKPQLKPSSLSLNKKEIC